MLFGRPFWALFGGFLLFFGATTTTTTTTTKQQQQQQQQTTNNKQQTTNNKQQTTNNKQQTTNNNNNNQQPTTNNQQPTTNNQQPTTNNQQPTTNNQQPTTTTTTTNNQQPTTNNQQPTTNNQQPTTNNQQQQQEQEQEEQEEEEAAQNCDKKMCYRQGVVRRNISPEACRDLVEARMLAERMERSFSEHCSQVLFRIPPVLLLQPQLYWAPCTCVAAVGTWTRWPPAGALGPHAPFRAHPVPLRSCWCLPRAGQGVQGVVRYNILAPCPVPRRPGSVHDLFGAAIKPRVARFHLLVWEVAGH